MHGAAKTHPVIVAVIRLQSITIISCTENSNCNHNSNIVAENQGNPKALWNCFKILHRSYVTVLPDCTNKTNQL